MDPWGVAVGLTSLGASGVYLLVAQRISQRPVAAAARLASTQFALWWFGLAAEGALSGLEALLAAFGGLTFPLAMTFLVLVYVVDCVLLWGLVGYLTYLYTGKHHLVFLSGFYALFFTSAVYYDFAQAPYGVVVHSGVPTLLYATNESNPILIGFILFALIVPEFVGAFLYLSLVRRTRDRTIRYRIVLVSTSILLWFLLDVLSTGLKGPAGPILGSILSAGAALLSLIAFYPPLWVQRRLGVTAVPHTGAEGSSTP